MNWQDSVRISGS